MITWNQFATEVSKGVPKAIAYIRGNEQNPMLSGVAAFYDTRQGGVVISVEVSGLPENTSGFYGMHLHQYGNCQQPFDKTGNHYNPHQASHPEHAGDLPPLLGNAGYAWTMFYTGRISIEEVVGKSIVIHSMQDDFHSQPAGDSGSKIGCGGIVPCEKN